MVEARGDHSESSGSEFFRGEGSLKVPVLGHFREDFHVPVVAAASGRPEKHAGAAEERVSIGDIRSANGKLVGVELIPNDDLFTICGRLDEEPVLCRLPVVEWSIGRAAHGMKVQQVLRVFANQVAAGSPGGQVQLDAATCARGAFVDAPELDLDDLDVGDLPPSTRWIR